uniref:Uncharacterized protein n=1 Tax=Plectus sambesii TaxID=2011161 RepID=A0A914VHN8_9BILA
MLPRRSKPISAPFVNANFPMNSSSSLASAAAVSEEIRPLEVINADRWMTNVFSRSRSNKRGFASRHPRISSSEVITFPTVAGAERNRPPLARDQPSIAQSFRVVLFYSRAPACGDLDTDIITKQSARLFQPNERGVRRRLGRGGVWGSWRHDCEGAEAAVSRQEQSGRRSYQASPDQSQNNLANSSSTFAQ